MKRDIDRSSSAPSGAIERKLAKGYISWANNVERPWMLHDGDVVFATCHEREPLVALKLAIGFGEIECR
jgi:hypothetical protein